MTDKKPITAVRLEREPEPPGPVFSIMAVDGLAMAEVRGRDSEEFARLLAAAPGMLGALQRIAALVPDPEVSRAHLDAGVRPVILAAVDIANAALFEVFSEVPK